MCIYLLFFGEYSHSHVCNHRKTVFYLQRCLSYFMHHSVNSLHFYSILIASCVDISKSSSVSYDVAYMYCLSFILLLLDFRLYLFFSYTSYKQFSCQHYCSCFFVHTSKCFSSRCLEIKLLSAGGTSLYCEVVLSVICTSLYSRCIVCVFVCIKIEILLSIYFCGLFSHLTFYWELVSFFFFFFK